MTEAAAAVPMALALCRADRLGPHLAEVTLESIQNAGTPVPASGFPVYCIPNGSAALSLGIICKKNEQCCTQ